MKTILFSILNLIPLFVSAQLIGGFSGGDDLSVGPGTAGYSFTIGSSSVTVQALGVWDASGSGLSSSHEIGIWDTTASHSLLASAVVPSSGGTEINGFWYVPVTALTLQVGTTYRIGAAYADSDLDLARGNATLVTANKATVGDAYLSSGNGFEFPDVNAAGANSGFYGPNLSFSAVPEPTVTAFATALILLGFAAFRSKQRQAQAS